MDRKASNRKKAPNLSRTFEEFIQEQGFELHFWQKRAANALLEIMYFHRVGATGKSFLIKQLWNFITEYGSFYEIEKSDHNVKTSSVTDGDVAEEARRQSDYLAYVRNTGEF